VADTDRMRASLKLRDQRGFTMPELLTVIVIIGLLLAIVVPVFLHHRDRARDSQAKANVRAAQTAAMEIGGDNGGRYDGPDGVTVANLREYESALADADLTVPLAMEDTYTVRIQSETGNTFDVSQNDDGTTDLTCASADDAGCPSDGTWD
jgi:prepilin-type N-terminal cleavage/methylation domain-containing protein